MAVPVSTAAPAGFWTFTFWGIFGTVSGIVGAFSGLFGLWISYFTFTYKKPSIYLDINELSYPKKFMKAAEDIETVTLTEGATLDPFFRMEDPQLRFDLYININNKGGGAGSIQKPQLIIRGFHEKAVCPPIDPVTDRITGGPPNPRIVNLGQNYYLQGGDRKDKEYLQYSIDNAVRDRLMKDKFHFQYYIGYKDNSGKYHEMEIKKDKIRTV